MKIKSLLSLVCMVLLLLLSYACGNKTEISLRTAEDTVIVSIDNPKGYLLVPVEYDQPACEVELETGAGHSFVGNICVAQNKIDDYVPIALVSNSSHERLLIFNTMPNACFADSIKVVDVLSDNFFRRKKPSYHYFIPYGRMGVPAAAFFDGNRYHLYFQSDMYGIRQDNVCWGHAVSDNLTDWDTLPIALEGDSIGETLGGTCVLDTYNSFGAGKNSIVCLYTATRGEGGERRQEQCIAYAGCPDATLQKFATNPVLRTYDDIPDFRFPSVVRYKRENMWDVVIACGDHWRIYSSSDLANWNLESRLGQGWFEKDGQYERASLMEIERPDGSSCWLLLCNVQQIENNAFCNRVVAYLGDFDGKTFRPQSETPVILDYGQGSGILKYENVSGRVLLAGLLYNADGFYDERYCNMMALPREMSLIKTDDGEVPILQPSKEVDNFRKEESKYEDMLVKGEKEMHDLFKEYNGAFEMDLISQAKNNSGFSLYNDSVSIMFYLKERNGGHVLVVDKSECCGEKNNTEIPLRATGEHQYRLFVDNSAIELFIDSGRAVFSELLPIQTPLTSIKFFAEEGEMKVKDFFGYSMAVKD